MNYPVTTGFVWVRIGSRQAEAVFCSGMKVVACTGHEVVLEGLIKPYIWQTWRLDEVADQKGGIMYLGIRVYWTKTTGGAAVQFAQPLD